MTDKHLTHYILPMLPIAAMMAALILLAERSQATNTQSIEEIKRAAIDHAHRLGDISGVMVTNINSGTLDRRLNLAACQSPLETFLPYNVPFSHRMTVGVRCNDQKTWTLYVPVQIESEVTVLVLTRSLRRGETLTRSDIKLEKRSFVKTASAQLRRLDVAIGQQASRSLPAGSVLTHAMMSPPKLIQRGDQIALYVKIGQLTVRGSAEALEDGAEGDKIWLKNSQTRRKVAGLVQKDGSVTVISP